MPQSRSEPDGDRAAEREKIIGAKNRKLGSLLDRKAEKRTDVIISVRIESRLVVTARNVRVHPKINKI